MIHLNLKQISTICQVTTNVSEEVLIEGVSTDSRTLKPGNLFVALIGEQFDGHDYLTQAIDAGAKALLVCERKNIVADDFVVPVITVKDTLFALGELAKYWREQFPQLQLAAVTGSNGKTSVKDLFTSILYCQASDEDKVLATAGNFNNLIGLPKTLFNLNTQHQLGIVELGMNVPGEMVRLSAIAQPDVAVVTNVGPAHLAGVGDEMGVAREKGAIFTGLSTNGKAVLNIDSPYYDYWRDDVVAGQYPIISFGLSEAADVCAECQPDKGFTRACLPSNDFNLITPKGEIAVQLPLLGEHNVMNALAASAMAYAFDIDLNIIKQGLEQAEITPGRLQFKQGLQNSLVIDDTYNANPASLKAALAVFKHYQGRKILVLGDMGELGKNEQDWHRQVAHLAKNNGINKLYALGDLTKLSVAVFGEGAIHFNDHAELIQQLKQDIENEDGILVKGSRFMKMETIVKEVVIN